jgi:hypothetical protein
MLESRDELLAPMMDVRMIVQRWKADLVSLKPKNHGYLKSDSLNSGCRL